jgi:hypothetical protein
MAIRKLTDRRDDDKARRLSRPSRFRALPAVPAAAAVAVAAGLAFSQSAIAGPHKTELNPHKAVPGG